MRDCKNRVDIVGYLKDNTLVKTTDETGEEIIKGALIVATNEHSEYRIQYYTRRYKKMKPGDTERAENRAFASLCNLTKDQTVTYEQCLGSHMATTFEGAKPQMTKVHCSGSLQEWLRLDREGVFSPSVTIKGVSAGVANAETFDPKARFEIEVYIDNIYPEKKKDEDGAMEETGRYVLVGLYPEYDDSVSEISFVTANEEVANYISSVYNKTQTVSINGDLVNLAIRRKTANTSNVETFGRQQEERYITEFVNERQIFGGQKTPYEQGDENALSIEDIKAARVLRDSKIKSLKKPEATRPSSFSARPTAAPAPSGVSKGAASKVDFDF